MDAFALDQHVWASSATRWWSENLDTMIPPRRFLARLFSREAREAPKLDFPSLVERLQAQIVRVAASLRRAIRADGAPLAQVIGRFESFLSLAGADPDDREAMQRIRLAAVDLMAFLLVNQLLFYRIYTARHPDAGLPPLPRRLSSLEELSEPLRAMAAINYDAIFGVDLASAMAQHGDAPFLLEEASALANTLPVLRPEHVSHDLVGPLFHDLLPFETRKTLGAFFTRPEAAEALAAILVRRRKGLSIGSTVMDPSCGSGTLLVAAYRAFMREEKPRDSGAFHRKMIKERVTGIDVMPFAASLTATNLSAQDVGTTLRSARVGMANTLGLSPGAKVPAFPTALQELLEGLGVAPSAARRAWAKGARAVSPRGPAKPFQMYPPDYVLLLSLWGLALLSFVSDSGYLLTNCA